MRMPKARYRLALCVTLLVASILACNTISSLQQDTNSAKKTIVAAETSLQGVVTQANIIATAVEGSSVLKTAAARATEEGGALLETGEAYATRAANEGLLETAQAAVTEQGSSLLGTVQAMATAGVNFGQAPADIPLVNVQNIVNFAGSDQLVTYSTNLDYDTVLAFYKEAMPKQDWSAVTQGSVENKDSAILKYAKGDRLATVTLSVNPIDNKAIVVILVQGK
jgi:hypothetical protein